MINKQQYSYMSDVIYAVTVYKFKYMYYKFLCILTWANIIWIHGPCPILQADSREFFSRLVSLFALESYGLTSLGYLYHGDHNSILRNWPWTSFSNFNDCDFKIIVQISAKEERENVKRERSKRTESMHAYKNQLYLTEHWKCNFFGSAIKICACHWRSLK